MVAYITVQEEDGTFSEFFIDDKNVAKVNGSLMGLALERVAEQLNAQIMEENDHGFICEEFDADGSCIHSDHMMLAGM